MYIKSYLVTWFTWRATGYCPHTSTSVRRLMGWHAENQTRFSPHHASARRACKISPIHWHVSSFVHGVLRNGTACKCTFSVRALNSGFYLVISKKLIPPFNAVRSSFYAMNKRTPRYY